MRIYVIEFYLRLKENSFESEVKSAKAYAKGECPYEALFTLREHLLESSVWESLGAEVMNIADENHVDFHDLKRYLKQNHLLLEIESLDQEQIELALSA